MEHLRERLYEAIDKFGLASEETIMLSQMLDNPVVEEQKKRYEEYKEEREINI